MVNIEQVIEELRRLDAAVTARNQGMMPMNATSADRKLANAAHAFMTMILQGLELLRSPDGRYLHDEIAHLRSHLQHVVSCSDNTEACEHCAAAIKAAGRPDAG